MTDADHVCASNTAEQNGQNLDLHSNCHLLMKFQTAEIVS